jgi:uncharacterized protein (TIGR00251 family)
MFPFLQQTVDGVVLRLLVQPRSSKNQLVGLQGDLLKIKLCSPPVDGAANKSCCDYLAKLFGIAKGRVELIAGDKARQKSVLLRDVDLDRVETILRANLPLTS